MIEITIETKLQGPLANRLQALADKQKRPPVEVMADLVELALRPELGSNSQQDLEKLKAENNRLHLALAAKGESFIEFHLGQPSMAKLALEAERRSHTTQEFVRLLVLAIVNDNLYSAVIDD